MADFSQTGRGNDLAPLLTVAIPVFNAGRYLRLAVLSIVRQTFTNWELLIVDDGSTDDALVSIQDIDDPRIRIIRNGRNTGLAASLNAAIEMARGKYLARMDQDDIAYPERFSRQISALEEDSCLDLVAVRCMTISDANEPVGMLPFALSHEDLVARPWVGFYLPHPTWMGKTEWFRRHRYTIPEIQLAEDQELLLRSHASSRFSTIPEVLFGYRIRARINWRKQVRSRRALLKTQLACFTRSGKVLYALLSVFAFGARVAMDLVNVLGPGIRRLGPHRTMHIDDTELIRWQAVLGGLEKACGTRR